MSVRHWLVACVVGASSLAAAAWLQAQAAPPNVLLVTIDTVRADHLGAYGYTKASTPAIDRLAREGVRFADATTQAPLTGPAHAAILTGAYPGRFGVRDNATTPLPASAVTAAEIFKARGYRTGAFVGAFILDQQYGFGQGFDTFGASFPRFIVADKMKARRAGGEVVDGALAWLGATSRQPFFAWVHLYDAHAPYEPPAPFRTQFRTAPYDGAVAYVDAQVGRLIAALEASGRLDNTLVAVVSDHGEGLGDHGESEHGLFLYEGVLRIPWVMRLPGKARAGTVVESQVRAIDVLPTLAQLSGGAAIPRIDGESVAALVNGGTRSEPPPSLATTEYPKLHFGWSDLKSVRVGAWKYIDAPRAELYDMKDRGEVRNLFETRGTLAAGLAGEMKRIEATLGEAATAPVPQADPDTLARLRSLGYIGVSAQSSGIRGADPKDKIAALETFRAQMGHALSALQRNDAATAIPLLKRLVADNDRSYEVHLFLGDAYLGTGQPRNAVDEYTAAALLNPTNATPPISAARAHLAAGEFDQALAKLSVAEKLEPGTAEILTVRGMVFERQGKVADALSAYRAAVKANASDPSGRLRLAALLIETGDFIGAREQFTTLLRMNYRPSRAHFGLGQAAEGLGERAKAASEYREALRLEPGFGLAKSALERVGTPAGPGPQ